MSQIIIAKDELADANQQYIPPNLPGTTTSNSDNDEDASQQQDQATMAATTAIASSATDTPDTPPTPIEQDDPTQHQNSKNNNGGGRLWKLAGEESTQQQHPNNNKWAETFKARTRSCADPNATTTSTPQEPITTRVAPPPDVVAVTMNTQQLVFPNRDVLPVTQLLILGMVGILLGWLGNAVVGTSCYFAAVHVQQGQPAMHFGLYKYSTVESSYEYCIPYSGSYASQAPFVSRSMNILALFFGTLTLIVIWWTLVMGSGLIRPWLWIWTGRAAVAAGACQLATLTFYAETICRQHGCHLGPASYLNGIVALVWFGIAREMRLHSPDFSDDNGNEAYEASDELLSSGDKKAGLELPERARDSLYQPPGIC